MIKVRIDRYKKRWDKWKETSYEKGIDGISKANSDMILQYLKDMELGLNVNSKSIKGARSPRRLSDTKDRLIVFAKRFETLYDVKDMSKLNDEKVFKLFYDMRHGGIKRFDGKDYKSVDTLAKVFKAFWHWHQKVNHKKGINVEDITQDLDTREEKPDWVYLTEEQIKQICNTSPFHYRVLITFLLDTGLRPPLELLPIKVSDLYYDYKELNIRIHKKNSFPRRIKLMLCSDLLKSYVQEKKLKPDDYLFDVCPEVVNRFLKKKAKELFGDDASPAGQRYSDLTMYDFRHNSCCYWLPRYKSESALKYRFGWKKSDKIHYYSELLGMKDTISEEDLLIDVTKTELEKELNKTQQENQILKERIDQIESQLQDFKVLAESIRAKAKLIEMNNNSV